MRYIALFVLAAVLGTAHADSWPPARPAGAVSGNGDLVLRVEPGDSLGDVYGFAGAKKYATASLYRRDGEDRYTKIRETQLLNPVAPVDFVLSDAGELVTFDNWHNLGVGKALVVYGADGTVTRSYTLAEIYSPKELSRLQPSVSSVEWRCPFVPILERGSREVEFADKLGNAMSVNVRTGALSKRRSQKVC
jgi:hypothetical protein